MLIISRTDSSHPGFIFLVRLLDAELKERDGDDHAFYDQFNKIQGLQHCVVAFMDEMPVGCGAVKDMGEDTMEVKRMFVPPLFRGQGIAGKVLDELESWSAEMGAKRCVLETGKRQPEAIALYSKSGYRVIPNFGPYAGDENSVCFEKVLNVK